MRRYAAFLFALMIPTYIASAQEQDAPRSLLDPTPTPTATAPTPKDENDWVDFTYSRSLGPFMDTDLFDFGDTGFSDRSWLALEMRWHTDSNLINPEFAEMGFGVVYERLTLHDQHTEYGQMITSRSRLHSLVMREYFFMSPKKRFQRYVAIEAGGAFEFSTQTRRDEATGLYQEPKERDRILARFGIGIGARFRITKWSIISGEVRVPLYISHSVPLGIQAIASIGLRY